MAVHPSPLQSGQDVSHIDGSVIPKLFKPPHHFVHGPEGTSDLTSALRDVAAAVHEHFLLVSLPLLQVMLKCLTPVLLLLPLALLVISGLISGRNENFFSFGVALASGLPSPTSLQTPATPNWFIRFPRRGLGMFVLGHRCRGRC